MIMIEIDEEATARERVEDLRSALADSLNSLELKVELFKYSCGVMKWNDEVAFQVEDAMLKMGMALATLVNWYKDDEPEDKKEEGK